MKHIVFLTITTLAFGAWAQAPKEPAKESAKEMAKPMAVPAKQAAASMAPRKPRRWTEDARHCLERPSNTEIIKCAEEFF
ncbi:MAG: hypothetical protein ACREUS_13415 [Burkholderiales bacterium]